MPGKYRAKITMGGGGSGESRSFQTLDQGGTPGSESMRALRRLHASAVCVVTIATADGYRGITATTFTIASLSPPRVLVCLAQESEALGLVQASKRFAVSLLSDQQEFLAERFAGRAPLVNPRFDGVKHHITSGGNPVLVDALAWFDCDVAVVQPHGDHVVVFGDVREAGYGDGAEPLVYFESAYRSLQIG